MKRILLTIAIMFVSFGASAQLSFEETLAYIQEKVKDKVFSYEVLDFQSFEPIEEYTKYDFKHIKECNFELTRTWRRQQASEIWTSSVFTFDITDLNVKANQRFINLKDGSTSEGNLIKFSVQGYDDIWKGAGSVVEKSKKDRDLASRLKHIHQNRGTESFYLSFFEATLPSKKLATRIANAFNNLKETCPKDPFA